MALMTPSEADGFVLGSTEQLGSECVSLEAAQTRDLILESGITLGPGHLGIAASIGAVTLTVTKLPHLTILTTGDELIPADQTPLPHQLRQSSGITIENTIAQWDPALITRHPAPGTRHHLYPLPRTTASKTHRRSPSTQNSPSAE